MNLFPMFPMFPMKPYDALRAGARVCAWKVIGTIGNIGNIGNTDSRKGDVTMADERTRTAVREYVRETVQRMILAEHLDAAMVIPQMQAELMNLTVELWGVEVAADYAKQIAEVLAIYQANSPVLAIAASYPAGRA